MTAPLPSVSQALDTLAEFGDPDAIAAHLVELGHRGRRRSAGCCPVAVYLEATTGQHVDVAGIWMSQHGNDFGPLPGTVYEFVRRFDCERYPALDTTTAVPA